jgi:hypothetical protein
MSVVASCVDKKLISSDKKMERILKSEAELRRE